MTIETSEDAPNGTPEEYIEWLLQRTIRFHEAARQAAVAADARRAEIVASEGQYVLGALVRDAAGANSLADKDVTYKNHISAQQMYDRWTIREATVLTAVVAAAQHLDAQEYDVTLSEAS